MAIIETHGLTKYYGKSRGIIDLDLQVEEGEIFGFIGPNGAGKSTTIRTLLGLIFPSRGTGRIFGLDIVSESKAIKKHIGFIPSEVHFYDKLDVRELLQYSARFYGVDCDDRIDQLADLFDLDLDGRLLDLSSGNRKKVSILQSLIHRPRLLVMDEPTTGLDPLMKAKFFDLLRQENRSGTTIFFSSHTLSEVQKMCKRVAIIKEGRIIATEDIEILRKKQLRKIQIEFAGPFDIKALDCRGIISPHQHDHILSFMFSGRIGHLLQTLAGKSVVDLLIEEPTLEEIFMHYYDEE